MPPHLLPLRHGFRLLPRSLTTPTRVAILSPHSPTALHSRSFQTPAPTPKTKPPEFAFAFDIDGVLLHDTTPHRGATEALTTLSKSSIEFILLTNGGGYTEASRVKDLSKLLQLPINKSQFIQSHTPLAPLASRPDFNTVLVIGGKDDSCRMVAQEYGFRNVILPCDIIAAYPPISPFTVSKVHRYVCPLPENVKIDVVMVFNDPRDWALDIQLLLDMVLSDEGRLGTRRKQGDEKPHVPLYFSNPDLIWANKYHLPRLGQGGFREAFVGIYEAVKRTQSAVPELKYEIIGKPHEATYRYAEDVLCEWRRSQIKSAGGDHADLKTVYMVGDNPASDIAGANTFKSDRGIEWVSVLVKSGVYRDGDDSNGAKAIVENVLEGVKWAIKREEERV